MMLSISAHFKEYLIETSTCISALQQDSLARDSGDMWAGSGEWLARSTRQHRHLVERHRRRLMSASDTEAAAATPNRTGGLGALLHTSSNPATQAAVISANTSLCAVTSAAAAAAKYSTVWPAQHLAQTRASNTIQGVEARVRSLTAAFERAKLSSSVTMPASLFPQAVDDSEIEADAAVLIAPRCVRDLTETWESFSSAGGSAVSSECSSPFASYSCQHQKPVSRPVTPAAAPAPADRTAELHAAFGPDRASSDPAAAAALMCLRQASGQMEPIMELLRAAAAAAGQFTPVASGAAGDAPAAAAAGPAGKHQPQADVVGSLDVSRAAAAVSQRPAAAEDPASVLCRAAVFAGLVSGSQHTEQQLTVPGAPCFEQA